MSWKQKLANEGICKFLRTEKHILLREIISSLSYDKISVSKLIPNTKLEARPNTLSSLYGLNSFPPHTDFILEETPPRYLVLSAPRARRAKTFIFSPRDLFSTFSIIEINRSLFRISGLKSKFYSKLISQHGDQSIIRYNPAVMQPVNKEAKNIDEYIRNKLKASLTIDWNDVRTIIVDNWSVLHSRGEFGLNDDKMPLWRIALWG